MSLAEQQGHEECFAVVIGGGVGCFVEGVVDDGGIGEILELAAGAGDEANLIAGWRKNSDGFGVIDVGSDEVAGGVVIVQAVDSAGIVRAGAIFYPAVDLGVLAVAEVRRGLANDDINQAGGVDPARWRQDRGAAQGEDGAGLVHRIEIGEAAGGFGDVGFGDDGSA